MYTARCVAVLALLLAGCGLFEDQEAGYDLRYEVTGTFDACTIVYTDIGGFIETRGAALPFSAELTVVPHHSTPFVAEVTATCTAAAADRTVRASILVSGLRAADETVADTTTATAVATAALYFDGRIQER